jgi:alpha-N-arabinofuranosidase
MVNAIAPIFTNPDGLFLQTIYHPLRLYAEHVQEVALDPTVVCETKALDPAAEGAARPHRVADLGPFKLLDVSVTRSADGKAITVAVVNRDRDNPIATTIELADGAMIADAVAYEVNGNDPTVRNSFERPDAVAVQKRQLKVSGSQIEHAFSEHSITVLTVSL